MEMNMEVKDMDANELKQILEAKTKADEARQLGFNCMRDDEGPTKDEATKALIALYDVTFNPKPLMQAIKVYRKYVPVLLAHTESVGSFNQVLAKTIIRYDDDAAEKNYKRWTEEEDNRLIEVACRDDVSILEMSTYLGRSPSSIKARLTKLVGLHRVSEQIVGKFIGVIDNEYVEGHVDGTLLKEVSDAK